MKVRTKEIELEGRVVTIRELTVAELRNWHLDLKELFKNQENIDLVNHVLIEGAALPDLVRMTDLTLEDLDGMTPSMIDGVVAGCREVNPHFFRLRKPMTDAMAAQMTRK